MTAVQYDPNAIKVYEWLVPSFFTMKDFHGAASLLYEILETKQLSLKTQGKLKQFFEEAKRKQEDVIRCVSRSIAMLERFLTIEIFQVLAR